MYSFDKKAGQYRGKNGRFVSQSEIAIALKSIEDSGKVRLEKTSNKLINNKISVAKFQQQLFDEVKTLNLQSAMLAAGGKNNVDESIYKIVNNSLEETALRVVSFGEDISNGSLSVTQIRARSKQYALTVKKTYYAVEKKVKKEAGFLSAKRVLDNQARHCESCLTYANMNWLPIKDAIIPGTKCKCREGCKCSLIYRYY